MADLTQEARDEIAAAIRIARSDGLHVHKTYPAFLKAQADADKDKPPADDKTDGKPPPVKETPADEYEEVATLWGRKKVKKDASAAP